MSSLSSEEAIGQQPMSNTAATHTTNETSVPSSTLGALSKRKRPSGLFAVAESTNNNNNSNNANDEIVRYDNIRSSSNDDNNGGNNHVIDIPDSLITPNFEELARQYPNTFGKAYKHAVALQKQDNKNKDKDNNDGEDQHSHTNYHPLQQYVTQEFTIGLTKALLQNHFSIHLSHIPDRNLCPPVPNRYYYVQWIQKVLLPILSYADTASSNNNNNRRRKQYFYCDSADTSTSATSKPKELMYGLDIGTGATCIYPLLMMASSSASSTNNYSNGSNNLDSIPVITKKSIMMMYATDIDIESIEFAKQNVASNPQHSANIQVIHVPPTDMQQQQQRNQLKKQAQVDEEEEVDTNAAAMEDDSLTSLFRIGPLRRSLEYCTTPGTVPDGNINNNNNDKQALLLSHLDFCMTNPPFYDDTATTITNTTTEEIDDQVIADPRSGDGRVRTAMKMSEGTYPGGEVGFVIDMIVDGLYLFLNYQQQRRQSIIAADSMTTTTTTTLQLPPLWTSCMMGKKTSYVLIKHMLEQLLGYGHVAHTEFGPGHLTRWFIAWTFERPIARSLLTRLTSAGHSHDHHHHRNQHDNNTNYDWRFQVHFCSMKRDDGVVEHGNNNYDQYSEQCLMEVMDRIHEYCKTFPDHSLFSKEVIMDRDDLGEVTASQRHHQSTTTTVLHYLKHCHTIEIIENVHLVNTTKKDAIEPSPCLWPGDESLPDRFKEILQHENQILTSEQRRKYFLPDEGHFLLDVHLSIVGVPKQTSTTQTASRTTTGGTNTETFSCTIQIQVDAYRHTIYGMKIIQKIKNQFEGEICRTNRRWRRKLAAQQQQQQQQQQSPLQSMDES